MLVMPYLFRSQRSGGRTPRSGSVDRPVMGAFAQAPMRSRRPAVRVHPTPPIGPTDRPKDSNQRVRLTESQTRRETPHPSSLAYGSMLWPSKPRTTVCGVNQVLQLQYRVRWLSDDVSVRNDAAPVMVQLAGFSCSLSGETLIAEPSSDYSSVDAARAALET